MELDYHDNVYVSPEKFGLTPVAELDDPDASWSYDQVVVWENSEGKRYWAADSGCSCPIPFEDYKSIADLNPLPETESQLRHEVDRRTWDDKSFFGINAVMDFKRKVFGTV